MTRWNGMEEEKGVFLHPDHGGGCQLLATVHFLLCYLQTRLCDISQPASQSKHQARDEVLAVRGSDRPHFQVRRSSMPASLLAGLDGDGRLG